LTTAAHSTGTVVLDSFFQLASTAARSMVSTPPASASAAPAGGILAGCRAGS
jgi:hypothetical protein